MFSKTSSFIFRLFSLLALLNLLFSLLGATPVQAEQLPSIAGSTVTPDHSTYAPGASNTYSIAAYNASSDGDWLDAVTITFPVGWTITAMQAEASDSCGNAVNFTSSGISTNTGSFVASDGIGGQVRDGCGWTAVFTVTMPAGAHGGQAVNWNLSGDVWGDPPHDLTGSFTLTSEISEPDISVSPSSLAANLNPGDTTTSTLTVDNLGNANLTWSLVENPAVTWLSESPMSGTVVPGSNTPVSVIFDANGLADGTYTTTLQISSNDPDELQVDVPVTLAVGTAAQGVSAITTGDSIFSINRGQAGK